MSDRLRELQRQRTLAQEQVAWFDREIAKEAQPISGSRPPAAPAPVAGKIDVPAPNDPTGDEILAQYRQNPITTEKDVKRGCYLYFAFAMAAVVLFAVAVYLIYSRRP